MRTISTIQLVLFSVMPAQITGQTLSFFHSIPGLHAAVATNSSGIYVAGPLGVAAGATGVYVIGGVIKYDSGGNQLWTQGNTASGTGPQLLLRNYSDGGVELWTKQLQQEFTTAALAADASGVYAAVRDGFQHSLTKYSSDGSQLWNRQWDAPSQGVSLAVVTDTTGVYVLRFGTVGSFACDFQPRLCLEQPAQTIAKNGVVIRNDDSHGWLLVIHKIRILSAEL